MSRRILLADDSVTIQKVIELTFMDDDYEVRAVGNGDEAIAMLAALEVDFVIADVHMPGASGYEVCRRSKQVKPHVPVLLLVGTFEPFDEAQARECGADSYLKKPFDSQELLGRVHELLAPSAVAAAAPAAAAAPGGPGEPGEPGDHRPQGADEPPGREAPAAAPASPSPAVGAAAAAAAPPPPPAVEVPPPAPAAPPAAPTAVEAAASWQEFELEAEPELIPEPWREPPPPPGSHGAAAEAPVEQPFALGDLEEQEAFAVPETQAAGFEPAAAAGRSASEAAGRSGEAFTLGGPLDDSLFLVDQAEQEGGVEETGGLPGELRATRAEPVSPWAAGGATLGESAGAPPAEAGPAVGTEAGSEAPRGDAGATAGPEAGNGQPAAPSPAAAVPGAALGDQDIDRIARRVVELIGDRVVRDIAWEVIPDLAEVVIKDRLRELESQIE
jgi:CheY-like chemotaxis protein